MSKVQCPNCGGYKSSKAEGDSRPVVLLLVLLLLLTPMLTEPVGIPIYVMLCVAVFTFAWSRRPPRDLYTCDICGYEWKLVIGEPGPEVQSRPDLIQKGEQRLQEQEDERRRRMD